MKKQEVIRAFQLFGGVMVTLFVAGILVPSLMGSTKSANHSLFPGTLHTIHIAGLAFRYKLQNILAALVGTLFGAVMALVLSSRAARKKNTGSPAPAPSAAGDAGSARLPVLDLVSSFRHLAGILHFSRLK
jgi:ABC-type phosphate/phosphonate transport system permease subunit